MSSADDQMSEDEEGETSSQEEEEYGETQLTPQFKKLWRITFAAIGGFDDVRGRLMRLAALQEALYKDATYVNTVYERHGQYCTLLNYAVDEADLDVVNILLDYDANPNILCGGSNDLHTCIFTACMSRHTRKLAMALTLINHGLDINAKMPETICQQGYHNNYSTALHYACEGGNYQFVRLFLEHRADLYAVDSKGRTPLAIAVTPANNSRSNDEVLLTIRTLVEYGADLYAVDRYGQTLLHMAAGYPCGGCYNMDVVRYLVDSGVQDVRDLKGMSVGDVAVKAYSFNSHVLKSSRLFCKRLQTMLYEYKQRLVAFALGNRERGTGVASRHYPGAHSWRRIANA
jgi:hypothetical protein